MTTDLAGLKTVITQVDIRDFSKPITDIEAIKPILVDAILLYSSNILEERRMMDGVKLERLFELATGFQRCGRVEGLDDISHLESLVLDITRVRNSEVIQDKSPGVFTHIFELELPAGRKATSEWSTARILDAVKDAHGAEVYDIKRQVIVLPILDVFPNKAIVLRAPTIAPQPTDVIHFVLCNHGRGFELISWAPGPFPAHMRPGYSIPGDIGNAPCRVGLPKKHGKVHSTAFREQASEDIARAKVKDRPVLVS